MKQVVEGLLFLVGEEGISLEQIAEILEIDVNEVQELMNQLINDFFNDHGVVINKFGNLYKFTTKSEHSKYYKKLNEISLSRNLSQSALETLAIIAYNEPITRYQVDQLRGVQSAQMIRNLVARDLVKELGKSDQVGRPILYGITDQFLDYFGLSSRDELPNIDITKGDDVIENLYETNKDMEIEEI